MSLITRNIHELAKALLEEFPVVALIGARQVGKTTLAKQLRPDWRYFDLENPNDYDLITEDPTLFFTQFKNELIIDEAQMCPNLFNVLRGVIDQDRQLKGRFILTGSSSHELHQGLSESLAGRIAVLEVGTLKANEALGLPMSSLYAQLCSKEPSFDELLSSKPVENELMDKHWLLGGYPEPTLSNNTSMYWLRWMENYFASFIQRDLSVLFPKLNKVKFQRFIKMLGQLSNTIINRSDLGRALEISEGTVREYLSIAEGTYMWRNLPSYEKSVVKSIIKMPRGHLCDSGLLNFLLNIHTLDDLYVHPKVGHAFEGFVIEEIIRGFRAIGTPNSHFNYYRTRKGIEVDLILDLPSGIIPIEIKHGSHTPLRNLSALKEFIAKENNIKFGIVINHSKNVQWLSETILQVPVGYL